MVKKWNFRTSWVVLGFVNLLNIEIIKFVLFYGLKTKIMSFYLLVVTQLLNLSILI